MKGKKKGKKKWIRYGLMALAALVAFWLLRKHFR